MASEPTTTRRPRQPRTPRAGRNGGAAVRQNVQGNFEDVVMAEDDKRFNGLHKALHEQLSAATAARPVNSRVRKAVAGVKALVTEDEVLSKRLIVGDVALSGAKVQRSVPASFEKRELFQYKVSKV